MTPATCSTLGDYGGVRVVESTNVVGSALLADKYCGEGTELIYYLSAGQLLSRTFTFKDTHSPRGELLVVYAEVPRVGEENADQSRATTAILGFHSPSFTYGTDLILPSSVNAELREVLLTGENLGPGSSPHRPNKDDDDERALRLVGMVSGVNVPEVSKRRGRGRGNGCGGPRGGASRGTLGDEAEEAWTPRVPWLVDHWWCQKSSKAPGIGRWPK